MLAVGSPVGGAGEAPEAPVEETAGSIPNGGAGVSLITSSVWSSAVGGPSEYRCSGPPCTVLWPMAVCDGLANGRQRFRSVPSSTS